MQSIKMQNSIGKILKESVTGPKRPNLSATDFAIYFKSINNPNDPFFQSDDDILYFNAEIQIMFEEPNGSITQEEIMCAIKQLKNGRSGGPDKFLNEFFVTVQVHPSCLYYSIKFLIRVISLSLELNAEK